MIFQRNSQSLYLPKHLLLLTLDSGQSLLVSQSGSIIFFPFPSRHYLIPLGGSLLFSFSSFPHLPTYLVHIVARTLYDTRQSTFNLHILVSCSPACARYPYNRCLLLLTNCIVVAISHLSTTHNSITIRKSLIVLTGDNIVSPTLFVYILSVYRSRTIICPHAFSMSVFMYTASSQTDMSDYTHESNFTIPSPLRIVRAKSSKGIGDSLGMTTCRLASWEEHGAPTILKRRRPRADETLANKENIRIQEEPKYEDCDEFDEFQDSSQDASPAQY